MAKNENRASVTKGEARHGKTPAERVSKIEDTHVGSKGEHGVAFKLPRESEICDHSRLKDLD